MCSSDLACDSSYGQYDLDKRRGRKGGSTSKDGEHTPLFTSGGLYIEEGDWFTQ